MTEARTAFVLGGGGLLGAAEVGMMAALLQHGISPDLIVGTSIGALNGALLAADPSPSGVRRIEALWENSVADGTFGSSLRNRVSALASQRGVAASSPGPLRRLLAANLPVTLIEELPVEFSCVAASVERAAEHWFTEGPIIPAVLASAALPGMYPPVEIDGEHYLDGGLVNSIPLDRARKLGAERAFVLQVGRIEQPLRAPTRPWEVPMVALEVTRRARFHASLERALESMEVHVLPTGGLAPKPTERANFDPFDTSRVAERMLAAREATEAYLVEHGLIPPHRRLPGVERRPRCTTLHDGLPSGRRAVTLPLPSYWVRRLVLDPLVWFAGFWLLVMALPYLVILLAVLSFVLPGKWRLLRLTGFAIVYLASEIVLLPLALITWLLSGFGRRLEEDRWIEFHYRVLDQVLRVLFWFGSRQFSLTMTTDGPPLPGDDDDPTTTEHPLLVLSRHGGPGDSFLLVHEILSWSGRRPRIVLKDTLQFDPMIDVYLNRLPTRFLDPGSIAQGASLGGHRPARGDDASAGRAAHLPRGWQRHPASADPGHPAVARERTS